MGDDGFLGEKFPLMSFHRGRRARDECLGLPRYGAGAETGREGRVFAVFTAQGSAGVIRFAGGRVVLRRLFHDHVCFRA